MQAVPGVVGRGMTRQLDLEFLEATALRRARRGGVAQRDGQWLYRGRPMPGGVLRELYEVLAEDGLLQVADPDEYGLRRVGLSDRGENRYLELVSAQPTALRRPPPGHPTGAEAGVGARRGWCVAGCGCAVDVPPGGAVYVDCPACELPATTQAADQRQSVAPLDPAGDRPDPAGADGVPAGGRPVRVGRRSEQIVGRERDRIAARLAQRYLAGATLRDLADETGRSFGWVRTLLLEAGVVLRTRGGDHSGGRSG